MSDQENKNSEGMNVIEDMGKGFKSDEGWTGKDKPEEPEENEEQEEQEEEEEEEKEENKNND